MVIGKGRVLDGNLNKVCKEAQRSEAPLRHALGRTLRTVM